jgi:hypothetical protein
MVHVYAQAWIDGLRLNMEAVNETTGLMNVKNTAQAT